MTLDSAIHAFNNWCYGSPMLSVLRDTKFGIPAVQTLHLMGITTVLGSIVVMNLRLFDLGYKEVDPKSFLPQVWRVFVIGLLMTVVAGIVVFLPDPVRYVNNTSFRVKMATLAVAILYQFTIFRKAVRAKTGAPTPLGTKIVSALSLLLWFGVGWCGRAIAFFG